MKNVLLASTALVAFTGAAVADVALSGRAEMGVFDGGSGDAEFFTDIDVTFTMSGETDGGLTFGASVDLDEADGSGSFAGGDTVGASGATGNNSDDGGATIFISGGFGTVTMGDTDGALDWALTEAGNVGNPGSLADDETSHAGYVGSYLDGSQDGQILRWDYSMGAFGVAVSVDDNSTAGDDIGYAVGLKYTADLGGTAVAFGIGYQESGENFGGTAGREVEALGVSATATLGSGLSVGVVYADWDDTDLAAGFDSHYGIGLGYSTGALSLHANYGEVDFNGGTSADGFGLAAAYDLGGGAVVHLGYGDGTTAAGVDSDTWSFGLGLSF